MTEPRGKRKWAVRLMLFWLASTIVAGAAIIFGDLKPPQLNALLSLHDTISATAMLAATSLLSLDGIAAQIIPAWKGKTHEKQN